MQRRLNNLENTLFGKCAREDNGEVRKRRNALTDSCFVRLDIRIRLALDKVPFIDTNDQTLLVLLDQRVDIEVLCLNTARRVNHQDTNIAVLDRTNRTNDRVVLQVFRHFRFLSYTGRIDQVKILAELIVPRIDTVSRRARDIRHDRTLFADERIQYA